MNRIANNETPNECVEVSIQCFVIDSSRNGDNDNVLH